MRSHRPLLMVIAALAVLAVAAAVYLGLLFSRAMDDRDAVNDAVADA